MRIPRRRPSSVSTCQAITAAVTDVTLRIWVTNGSGNGPDVFASDPNWDESTVTWSTRPTLTSGQLADANSAEGWSMV